MKEFKKFRLGTGANLEVQLVNHGTWENVIFITESFEDDREQDYIIIDFPTFLEILDWMKKAWHGEFWKSVKHNTIRYVTE